MKPKLTDVAKLAGVSLATADRVINNRPGVRRQTRIKVQAAVKRLGYQRDPVAASLARSERKTIAIVLPTETLGIYDSVLRCWPEVKASMRFERVELLLMPYSPLSESGILRCLTQAEKVADGVILCALDKPEVHELTIKLTHLGLVVHTFITDLSAGSVQRFVGFDNYKVGRTIGYFMKMLCNDAPGIVCAHPSFPKALAQKLRVAGMRDFIGEQEWDVDFLASDFEEGNGSAITTSVSDSPKEQVVGVICMGDESLKEMQYQLRDHWKGDQRPKVIVLLMDISKRMVEAIVNDEIDAIFFLDVGQAIECSIGALNTAINEGRAGEAHTNLPNKCLDTKIYVKENLPNWCLSLLDEPVRKTADQS